MRVGLSILHGRGVFATRSIAAGDVIEVCQVLLFSKEDSDLIDQTVLYGYYFAWPDAGGALALGCGSLYNHSSDPNAYCEIDVDAEALRVVAHKDIQSGDEVTIEYAAGEELWFTPNDPT